MKLAAKTLLKAAVRYWRDFCKLSPAELDQAMVGWRILGKYGYPSGMCVDASGSPIPWITYPAIEYLSTLDFRACVVFEYGQETQLSGGRNGQAASFRSRASGRGLRG